MYTYEIAPVFNLMENKVISKIGKEYLEWPDVDGILAPGGSLVNFYGLLIARQFHFPQHKQTGMKSLPNLIIYTSELGHYSIEKAAIMLGFGLN